LQLLLLLLLLQRRLLLPVWLLLLLLDGLLPDGLLLLLLLRLGLDGLPVLRLLLIWRIALVLKVSRGISLLPGRLLLRLPEVASARSCAVFIEDVPYFLACEQQNTAVRCLEPVSFFIGYFTYHTFHNASVVEINDYGSSRLGYRNLYSQNEHNEDEQYLFHVINVSLFYYKKKC
jgi:hypothetical protein